MNMSKQIGGNDPCPCGSGRKYKNCCISKESDIHKEFKEIFKFEPGSYGDVGNFMPSLACLRAIKKDEWKYHFVLVKPASVHPDEDTAVSEAEKDISKAYQVKQIDGTDGEIAIKLRQMGYISVDNFNVVRKKSFLA